jgi:hypothetical protein
MSLDLASANVGFPIPKLTFESTAASHNELFVGYVVRPANSRFQTTTALLPSKPVVPSRLADRREMTQSRLFG